jgi:hypothetical protein
MTSQARYDAETLGAYLRELEDIETEVQKVEYADLPFASGRVVPLDIQNKPWAQQVTYRQMNRVGSFALQRSYSSTVPMIELLSEEFTQKVYKYAGGYYFSDDDVIAFEHTGLDHEAEKIAGVREASEQQMNQLIAFGDKTTRMHGFLNNPDVLYSYSPLRLDSSSTPKQILAVLNDAVTAVVKLTNQVERPDTMLLPIDQFHYLGSTQVAEQNSSSSQTILKFFLESNPYIKDIEPINELSDVKGVANQPVDLMVVYKRDKSRIKARITQPLTFLQVERRKLGYERPAVFRYGGIVTYRPYSMHIVAGV